MKTQLGAILAQAALLPHFERLAAAAAEFEFTLRAGEVHATTLCEGVAELATGAVDSVDGEMLLEAGCLVVRVVGLDPFGVLGARDAFVLLHPLEKDECQTMWQLRGRRSVLVFDKWRR